MGFHRAGRRRKTTTVNATLTPSGTPGASISGTVYYPGYTLSAYAKAFADTLDQNLIVYPITYAPVNPGNGTYTIQISNLTTSIQLAIEAVDDANNSGAWESGEGWGFYDGNGNAQWDTDDIITLSPGQNLTGINISLQPYTTVSPKISSKISR